ncbi:MAG: hypothetical protein HZB63_10225 [Deltaproteobacteria bacterium]|nr:hypothetical protein [Deltaproteobacteria bacterium]
MDTYTIEASAGAGGRISPTGAVKVTRGNAQGFTITPDSGYLVQEVEVDGVSVGAVESYLYYNITAPHTISATFVSGP